LFSKLARILKFLTYIYWLDVFSFEKSLLKTHNQHVVPHEEGWAVRGAGNTRVTATFKYQDDAIDRATEIAKNYKSDVIIHRTDGTIRDRRSY